MSQASRSTYLAALAELDHVRAICRDEPDTGAPCEAWGCPRPGLEHHGDILCGFHRNEETTRVGWRRIGPRGAS